MSDETAAVDAQRGTANMERARHWDAVYESKADSAVSWFEPAPIVSLELIRALDPPPRSLIDVGGGASRLVDCWLSSGGEGDIAVLDVSEVALNKVKARLGPQAQRVRFLVGDVTQRFDVGTFDLWHDRAVFHFLTEPEERQRYAALAARSVRPGGHAILGAFAPEGPKKCSGLEVCRYDAAGLARELGPCFQLVSQRQHEHVTPSGAVQAFCFAVLRRERL